MNTPGNPLLSPTPTEVPLVAPPLVRVIAQVRFPMIASVERRDFIAPFQEAIREDYPILRPEQSRSVVIGHEPLHDLQDRVTWRFHDPRSGWKVALAPDFLALETDRYSSREDFLTRFKNALLALEAHIDPKLIDRLGVRYIDRVEGVALSDLPALIRPEVGGILSTGLSHHVLHALSEHAFVLPDEAGFIRARWGWLPAGATVDPAALEPIDAPSWLLDLDAFQTFRQDTGTFDVEDTVALARSFAERIYGLFRWAVTDQFLLRYGGQP